MSYNKNDRVYIHNSYRKNQTNCPYGTIKRIFDNDLYSISLDEGEYIKNKTIFVKELICHSDNFSHLKSTQKSIVDNKK